MNLEEVEPELQEARRSILEMDGLRHRALRKLISREFSRPNLMRNYEELLRDITRTTVDAALAKGEFDFVEDVSADFPIQVLARLLDVPQEKTGQLIDWGNEIIGFSDPEHARVLMSDAESEQYKHLPFRSPVSQEVFDYGRELAASRRGGEGTDLVSQLVNKIPEDGQAMTASEYDSYFLLLVVAGNETTRHTITHSMLALIEHPEQLAKLQADPSLIPDASRSSCAGPPPSTTSAVRRPATSSSTARRSRRATRSSCGSPPATATRKSSRTPTTST